MDKQAQHTPGPWVTADSFGPLKDGTSVQAAKGGEHAPLIASCTGSFGREGAQANARLIAAAPELLEALSLCVVAIQDEDPEPLPGTVWHKPLERARAALAKARGEA